MYRAIALFCLGLVLSTSAQAVPQDYEKKLPVKVPGVTDDQAMAIKKVQFVQGQLIATYEGYFGRGTITVLPQPKADPGGASPSNDHATPAAYRAVYQLFDWNLKTGTEALGKGYAISGTELNLLKVDGKHAQCGLIERNQAESAVPAGKERILLLDRFCAIQIGDDVVTVEVTTPTTAAARRKMLDEQIMFPALAIGHLLREHGK